MDKISPDQKVEAAVETKGLNEDSPLEDKSSCSVREDQPSNSESFNPELLSLSKINGEINRMTKGEITARLKELRLDPRGKKEVVQKRLKGFYRKMKLRSSNTKSVMQHYEYLIIVDFEATCEHNQTNSFRHEIIEFPAVLLQTSDCKIYSEFHSYVHPIINPKLSEFCTSLTGITQDKINTAPTFPTVLKNFERWLLDSGLATQGDNFAIATDGPWDMGRFMLKQCSISRVEYPVWCRKWINIRKSYSNFYKCERMSLQSMLGRLGMRFEGHPHCGRDDARNITRIAVALIKDGARLRVNEKIQPDEESSSSVLASVQAINRQEFLHDQRSWKGKAAEDDDESSDSHLLQTENSKNCVVEISDKCQQNIEVTVRSTINLDSDVDFPSLK